MKLSGSSWHDPATSIRGLNTADPSRRDRRFIVHVDMDAFFASIEQRDSPAFRSKPVVVGADPKGGKGRGVVSTCSYEARAFGIHSAMPISIAYRKCPTAIFLPVDMKKYSKVSDDIYGILYSFTPDIEPVGIDEAFLDITGSGHLFGGHTETCVRLKSKIKNDTGLTASVGLGPTKMAAKIASDLKKPDGMVEVTAEGLLDFLWPLEVRRLWGLGKKTEEALRNIGILTIGDLACADAGSIEKSFGKNGTHLRELANGIDESCVCVDTESKSISSETTFENDTADREKIENALIHLCDKVSGRLRRENKKSSTLTLKIRLEGFKTYTRAAALGTPTNFTDVLYKTAKGLYNNFDSHDKKIRLVGVRVSNFSQINNFIDTLFPDVRDKKNEDIHGVIDKIRNKFGEGSIFRASGKPSHD